MIPIPYLSQQPVDDFGLNFSGLKYSANLAANADTTLTIPGNARRYKAVIITIPGGAAVWMALNTPATEPAGATLAQTDSEMIKVIGTCREVKSGDVLHFHTTTASTPLSVILYAINTNS